MCSNSAVVESLECFMEELIQCFEEFVKKTLLVVTLAAGTLVAVVMYLLKNMQCRRACVTEPPGCPKRSASCCSRKIPSCLKLNKCPSSSTKMCVKRNSCSPIPCLPRSCSPPSCSPRPCSPRPCSPRPCSPRPCSPLSCSRSSSCESLPSIVCRVSAPSICTRKPCGSKTSCGSPFIGTPLPSCSPSPCKRSCAPLPGCTRTFPPVPACKRACAPAPSCTRVSSPSSCSRPSCAKIGKVTVPSLLTCNPPKYKLGLPACATIKPCNIPKRCPSKPCCKPAPKSSCCSMCCDKNSG